MAVKDLTVGNPSKVLIKFSLPLMGSIIFQQAYNIADSLVAGKFVGDNGLAAVGNAYEITLIFLSIAFGCNIGCSIILSQLFGAKRMNDLKCAVRTNLISSGVICIVLMILGFIFSPALLRLINTPEELMEDTLAYLNIYIGGLIFLFYYNISNGIFSALGDSKTPFYFLAVSSTANILMDIYFAGPLNMGVRGVAWATFICQGVSCVLALVTVMLKIKKINTVGEIKLFSFPLFKKIMIVAIPSMLQQLFVSIGNIFVQSVVNSYGVAVMAGYSAAIKINNFVLTNFSTLGSAMSSFTAQNLGARRIDRVKKGYKSAILSGLGISVIYTALIIIFKENVIGLFMDSDSGEAMSVGCTFLMTVTPFYCIISLKIISDAVTRGAGCMSMFMIATFLDLIIRVVLAFVFSGIFKQSYGIWYSWPVGWIIGTAVSLYFYYFGKWENKQLI